MNGAPLHELAGIAGIATTWTDAQGQRHDVSPGILRFVLRALGLPADTNAQTADSMISINSIAANAGLPPLLIVDAGEPVRLPALPGLSGAERYRVDLEDGAFVEGEVVDEGDGLSLPAIVNFGYHRLRLSRYETVIAVAPRRCFTIDDLSREATKGLWGVTAPVYGLRRNGDGGIGDFAALAEYGRAAAAHGASAFAINPVHALFSAVPERFSPYSPSTRAFLNPLYADGNAVFGESAVGHAMREAGLAGAFAALEALPLIDWPKAGRAKLKLFRHLFDSLRPQSPTMQDFMAFRAQGGESLEDHARFEALHALLIAQNASCDDWRNWPTPYQDPRTNAVREISLAHECEVSFHAFLQWLAARSLAEAQKTCREAGMAIGLITDLAIGAEAKGSHSWSRQGEMLEGLSIGAPSDAFNIRGQSWGIVPLNPHTMPFNGYRAFIEALRATMAHAGGIRIDHAMGLERLWVIPEGATPSEGAYINYPVRDLIRLIALESWRNRAIVMGEDLGTIPEGFRAMLHNMGMLSTEVMWFERDLTGFFAPNNYSRDAMATTTTHDLPTVAGWWSGRDIEDRLTAGVSDEGGAARERDTRRAERDALWRSFVANGATQSEQPPPSRSATAVNAAATFIGKASSPLVILPLNDAFGVMEQENMPGTFDEYPNWRHRLPGPASALAEAGAVSDRLAMTAESRPAKKA